MKPLINLLSVFVLFIFASCSKSSDMLDSKTSKGKNYFQVYAIGADTTKTNILVVNSASADMTNPHDSENEDNYMKLKLLGYFNGEYIIEVTNKQSCQADIELHYDGVDITAIVPNKKNSLTHIWVASNSTETFKLKGPGKIGKIKAKALTICNWKDKNPKWVSVDITAVTLPIDYTEVKATNIGGKNNNKVKIEFSIDDPASIDRFEIWQSIDGKNFSLTKTKPCDRVTKRYSIEMDKL